MQLELTQLELTQPWPATNTGGSTAEAGPAVRWPDPPADTTEREAGPTSAPSGQEHASKDLHSDALDEPPVQHSVVASGKIADFLTVAHMRMLLLVAGAVAVIGFLARAIFDVAAARRRRVDVYRRNAGVKSQSPVLSTVGGTGAPPLPPMELNHRHEAVEEALRQFSRAWERRAA
jgi:hypothetical protein